MLVTTDEAKNGFYPTPPALAAKMLDGIKWDGIDTVLEPSAGKGDLILAIPEAMAHYKELDGYGYYRREELTVHAIEIDPYLRSTIKLSVMNACSGVINQKKENLEMCRALNNKDPRNLSDEEREKLRELDNVSYYLNMKDSALSNLEVSVVHDDFLTFDSFQKYDLILMNPPFANGCRHLMHAIQLSERYGCEIRCLLNAETIQNPYTNDRKELIKTLEKYNASVDILHDAFSDAERKTDVSVALIKISIPARAAHSDIFDRLEKAAEAERHKENPECQSLSVTDFLQDSIARYKLETDVGIKLIDEYHGIKPFLMNSFDESSYRSCILELRVDGKDDLNVNRFLQKVRLKYWNALFRNDKVMGKLTTSIREKYCGIVNDFKNYEFSMFNIQQLFAEMNAELTSSVEETISKLFEEMSAKHAWYPECSNNVHYYNGWKTNKAHKINDKVILPANQMFSSWSNKLDVYTATRKISDIEKVFDYFDGNVTASVNLENVLTHAAETGNTRNIPCKYFTISIFKKGTMHIKFTNKDLLEHFNIYCCQNRAWLPPDYGKRSYDDMTDEAKVVVDSFNGDGSDGSGKKAYDEIFKRSDYYLCSPTGAVPLLASAKKGDTPL